MKLHFAGKFNGDPATLPHPEHKPGAVKFREPEDPKKLAKIANSIALVCLLLTFVPLVILSGFGAVNVFAILLSLVLIYPHEFLHAICFRKDAYIYSNLKNGMMFVVGTEDMSKARFVVMSLLPNIVFGFIPYIIFLIRPELTFIGTLGAASIPAGAGDYLNVYNALQQMPRGARTYLHGFSSWWYMPE